MPPEDFSSLPFLTRKMLDFEHATKLDLSLDIWSNLGKAVIVSGITKAGPFLYKIIAPTDNLKDNHIFGLPDIPIYVSVYTNEVEHERGDTYVSLSIRVNSASVYNFISGYVSTGLPLTWPNGRTESNKSGVGYHRSYTGTDQAANTEIEETVTDGQLWRLHSVMFTLVTDATVADRRVSFIVTNPPLQILRIPAPAVQAASKTVIYMFGRGLEYQNDTNSGIMTAPLPTDYWLKQAVTFGTSTLALQATDNFGSPVVRLEQLRYL